MNRYEITVTNTEVPALRVQAATLTGAFAKAQLVNAKLFPNVELTGWSGRLVQRKVR